MRLLESEYLEDFEWILEEGRVFNTYRTDSLPQRDIPALWDEIERVIREYHPEKEVPYTTIVPTYVCPQTAELYYRCRIPHEYFKLMSKRLRMIVAEMGFSFDSLVEDILLPCEGTDDIDFLIPSLDTLGWKVGGDVLDLYMFAGPLAKTRRLEHLCALTGNDFEDIKLELETLLSLPISEIVRAKLEILGVDYRTSGECDSVLKMYYYLENLTESERNALCSAYGHFPEFEVVGDGRFSPIVRGSLLSVSYSSSSIVRVKHYYRLCGVEYVGP